jgi:hypothetical protein
VIADCRTVVIYTLKEAPGLSPGVFYLKGLQELEVLGYLRKTPLLAVDKIQIKLYLKIDFST